jgi:hypothetical protein
VGTAVRINSDFHKRLPTFFVSSSILLGRRRNRLSVEAVNNNVYLAATMYWRHRPVITFGMWT